MLTKKVADERRKANNETHKMTPKGREVGTSEIGGVVEKTSKDISSPNSWLLAIAGRLLVLALGYGSLAVREIDRNIHTSIIITNSEAHGYRNLL